MAKPRKKQKDSGKVKKKRWYQILAPPIFNSQPLGETTSIEQSKVIGKTLRANLMTLTGEVRNQNVNIRFRIKNVKEGKAETEIIGYKLSPSFIKRVVRRRHSRIDATETFRTKDRKQVKLKLLLITKNVATRSEMTALRKNMIAELRKMSSSAVYDEFVRMVIFYKLQLDLRRRLSKIYPLKTLEVKNLDEINMRESLQGDADAKADN